MRAIIKTPVLYSDLVSSNASVCRLDAVYQLRDSQGSAHVLMSDLSVRLRIALGGNASVYWPCELPRQASSGVGRCVVAVCDDTIMGWFSTESDVAAIAVVEALYSRQLVAESGRASITLSKVVQYDVLAEAGMVVEIPVGNMPRFEGDLIAISIWANTGEYALDRWAVNVSFDTTVLVYMVGSFSVNGGVFSAGVVKSNT